MKKIIILFLVFSSLAFSNSAIQPALKSQKQETCKQELKIQDVERSGCCSWHGGVSGCSDGRVVCSDGTLSPSCTCNSNINPLG